MLKIFLGPRPMFLAILVDFTLSTDILPWLANYQVWEACFPIIKEVQGQLAVGVICGTEEFDKSKFDQLS
jgi:hypothetical protein